MCNHPDYSLTIRGFKTPAQVKAFIDWYEGQGEQDACIWFEIHKDAGKIDVDFMPVDVSKKYEWNEEQTNLTAYLKITS